MKNGMKPTLILALLLLALAPAQAQVKFEQEHRLRPELAPPEAQALVARFAFDKKIRWYRELSQNGASVEAKAKRGAHRYSLEFDTAGRLQDVEVEVSWENIPAPARQAMEAVFGHEGTSWHVMRAQIQYADADLALQHAPGPHPEARYEVVLRLRDAEGQLHSYECLFDAQGALLRRSRFVSHLTDLLEY
jgi:hypothetical protein